MRALPALLALLLLAGCQSSLPPPHQYLLSASATPEGAIPSLGPPRVVVVAPVRLAEEFDRTAMLHRSGSSELVASESDRWAERPSILITQVLTGNLQTLLPDTIILDRALAARQPGQVTVVTDLDDFLPEDEGAALLTGRWALLDQASGVLISTGRFSHREPVNGAGRTPQVQALDRSLLGLSRDIAEALAAAPRSR